MIILFIRRMKMNLINKSEISISNNESIITEEEELIDIISIESFQIP
jgi:hypothetical protein